MFKGMNILKKHKKESSCGKTKGIKGDQCSGMFCLETKLSKHKEIYHNPDHATEFMCGKCSKVLGTKETLRKHMDWDTARDAK